MRLLIILLLLITTPALAEEPTQTQKELITQLGVVYVGMSKEDLYKVFTPLQQKDYLKKGNEEWITFSDWQTEEPGDLITFHLKDGQVEGWKEGGIPSKQPLPSL